jgi:hypothetical protein
VSGDAFAGAKANLNASVGEDGVNFSAGASAGADASLTTHAEAAGFGVSLTGGGGVGAGGDVGFHANVDENGTYHLGGNLGIKALAGGSAGLDLSYNPDQFAQTAEDVGDAISDGVDAAGRAAQYLFG